MNLSAIATVKLDIATIELLNTATVELDIATIELTVELDIAGSVGP